MTPKRHQPPIRSLLLMLPLAAAMHGTHALAAVDVEFRVLTPGPILVGDSVSVGLFLVSDTPAASAPVAAVEIVFAWEADSLEFLSLDSSGGPPLSLETFPTVGSAGLNESNPPTDGDGLYVAFSQLGSPVIVEPAPGTKLTTFVFRALRADDAADVLLPLSAGQPPRSSIVFDGVTPNTDVTGALVPTQVQILVPPCPADLTTQGAAEGDPLFGVPDGLVTGADINYYVNAWVVGDASIADLTTQGAGPGDPGFGVADGLVTGADINYYVNLWVAGCP